MKRTLCLMCLAMILCGASVHARVIKVPSEAHPSIQSAVDAAPDGGLVLVAAGTYRENIVIRDKSILLKSIRGPRETVLDGGSEGCVVQFEGLGEARNFVIEGFCILNGTGNRQGGHPLLNRMRQRPGKGGDDGPILTGTGGGLHCLGGFAEIRGNIIVGNACLEGAGLYASSRCVIRDNVIAFNVATKLGGGIYLNGCEAEIANNYFLSNVGSRNGGGIYLYTHDRDVKITGNVFMDNWSFYGGGINIADSAPLVADNLFYLNMGCRGGAVLCVNKGAHAVVRDNRMERNWACYGGGVCVLWGASPTITGNAISYNTTNNPYCIQAPQRTGGDYSGGGLFFWDSGAAVALCNVIHHNTAELHGGGIGCSNSSPVIGGNTVYGNVGEADIGGLYCDGKSTPKVFNTIFWDNEPGEIKGGDPVLSGCDVAGGWPGEGNVDLRPGFEDAEGCDFHLSHDSPLRDAGVDYDAAPDSDFEGDPRRIGAAMDIGADEFLPASALGIVILCEEYREPPPIGILEKRLPEVMRGLPRWYGTPKWKPFERAPVDRLLETFTGGEETIPMPLPSHASRAEPFMPQALVPKARYANHPCLFGLFAAWIPIGRGWVPSGRRTRLVPSP